MIKLAFQKPHFLRTRDARTDAGQRKHPIDFIEWLLVAMISAFLADLPCHPKFTVNI